MNKHTFLTAAVLATSAFAQVQASVVGGPVPGLSSFEQGLFDDGKAAYEHNFTIAEGLGPTFNQPACSTCHAFPATGGSEQTTANNVTHFMLNNQGNFMPALEMGGPVIQKQSIASLPDGASCPVSGETLPPVPGITTSNRHTPPVFGFGLLDAVSDEEILEYQGKKPWKHSSVMGQVNWGIEMEALVRLQAFTFDPTRKMPAGPVRAGRFGWKAQTGTLYQFTEEPFNIELGVTTPFFPRENMPNGGPVPAGCGIGSTKPNDQNSVQSIRLMAFQALIGPPPRAPMTPKAFAGAVIFTAIGCADCHRPHMKTVKDYYMPLPGGVAHRVDALSDKHIAPYSDLLVHDMGPGLEDGRVMGRAGPRFWRTTPLWGARFKARYLHDGSAANLDEATERHGGEAQHSTDLYNALSPAQEDALFAFINSL